MIVIELKFIKKSGIKVWLFCFRMGGPMRPMQQANMAPPHQPHMHRNPHLSHGQMLSMPPRAPQHMHHIQHPTMSHNNPRHMIIDMNPSSNACKCNFITIHKLFLSLSQFASGSGFALSKHSTFNCSSLSFPFILFLFLSHFLTFFCLTRH